MKTTLLLSRDYYNRLTFKQSFSSIYGLTISYKENHKSFSVFLSKINDSSYFPSHLLADHPDLITKGLKKTLQVITDVRRIVCWAQFFFNFSANYF